MSYPNNRIPQIGAYTVLEYVDGPVERAVSRAMKHVNEINIALASAHPLNRVCLMEVKIEYERNEHHRIIRVRATVTISDSSPYNLQEHIDEVVMK